MSDQNRKETLGRAVIALFVLTGLFGGAIGRGCDAEARKIAPGTNPAPALTIKEAPTSRPDIRCVWSCKDGSRVAVGDRGLILIHDGERWQPSASGTKENLLGVWGTSGGDVYAVGHNEIFLHYDGAGWSPVPLDRSYRYGQFNAVWGSSSTDIYIVGGNRELLHFDGVRIEPLYLGAGFEDLRAVWGTSSDDVWVAVNDELAWRFDGREWRQATL